MARFFNWIDYFTGLDKRKKEVDWYRIIWFFLDWEMVLFSGYLDKFWL